MIRMTMMTRLLQVPAPHRPNSRNKAKQILKAGGSIKENIKKSLPIRSRLLAIKMDGSLITQCIRVMNMTVRLSQSFMKN